MNEQIQEQNNTVMKQIFTITLDQLLLYLHNNESMHPCSACGKNNWSIPLIEDMPAIYTTPSVRNPSISAWSFHVNCNDCGSIKIFNAAHVREYFFAEQHVDAEVINRVEEPDNQPSTEVKPLDARIVKLETHVANIQEDIDSLEGELQVFRTESREEFMSVRGEIAAVRAEMHEGFTGARSEIRKNARVRFWALVVIAGGLASLMVTGFGWI